MVNEKAEAEKRDEDGCTCEDSESTFFERHGGGLGRLYFLILGLIMERVSNI